MLFSEIISIIKNNVCLVNLKYCFYKLLEWRKRKARLMFDVWKNIFEMDDKY